MISQQISYLDPSKTLFEMSQTKIVAENDYQIDVTIQRDLMAKQINKGVAIAIQLLDNKDGLKSIALSHDTTGEATIKMLTELKKINPTKIAFSIVFGKNSFNLVEKIVKLVRGFRFNEKIISFSKYFKLQNPISVVNSKEGTVLLQIMPLEQKS